MSDLDIDVIGIDNAIIDIFATPEDDQLITSFGMSKGNAYLINSAKAEMLSSCLYAKKIASGGTVANTIVGLKSFGGSAGFIGKVGEDIYGERFVFELRERGIKTAMYYHGDIPTSQCFVIVSKDGTRTMLTYIDPKSYITKDDIDFGMLEKAKILYISGFMLDSRDGIEASKVILEFAKTHKKKLAITLASYLCTETHKNSLLSILDNYASFLFANYLEINTLFGVKTIDDSINIMIEKSKNMDCIFAINDIDQPALIIYKGNLTTFPPKTLPTIIDKTGYGAAFASGILYGYLQGYDFQQCTRIAKSASEQVLANLGARPLSEFFLVLDPNQKNLPPPSSSW